MIRSIVKLLSVAGAALMLTAVQAHEESGKPVLPACPDESEITSCSVQCMLALDVQQHISNEADRLLRALPPPQSGFPRPSISTDWSRNALICVGYCTEIHQALCLRRCEHIRDSLYLVDPNREHECRNSCLTCGQ